MALSGWGKGWCEWRSRGLGGLAGSAWGSGRGEEIERGHGDCEEGGESVRETEGSHPGEEEEGTEAWVGGGDERWGL